MQYYKVKIRLSGNAMNEVWKVVSAPEFLVLQYIHGVDALINPVKVKKKTVKSGEEKARLKGMYDQALVKREQSIDSIFGPLGMLPTELPSELLEHYDIVDADDIVAVAKNATKQEKKKPKQNREPKNKKEADNVDRIISEDEVSMEDIIAD